MSTLVSSRPLTPKEGYRRSAGVYDSQPNPILSLEHRFLTSLLPSVKNIDVIDLGCGTGRWLQHLVSQKPRTLLGIDSSPEMLEYAKSKFGDPVQLLLADCEHLPVDSRSADLVICSFVASYLRDLSSLAQQLSGIVRLGGSVFISDVHPGTVAELGWRRGFNVDTDFVDIETQCRPLNDIITAFEQNALGARLILEPQFGNAELSIFESAGKIAAYKAAANHPAIYILQFHRKTSSRTSTLTNIAGPDHMTSLTGARVAIGAEESVHVDVHLDGDRIAFLGCQGTPKNQRETGESTLDLRGFLLLPGLVNAHDHLEFALFPRLGKGGYTNFVQWAEDIHRSASSVIAAHRAVPKNTRLLWGGIRNLLSGVTTVCHHNPYAEEVFDHGFPLRVPRDVSWAHSISMDADIAKKSSAAAADHPFILHLAEGVDAQAADEVFQLIRERALDGRTVIVHGLALDERGKSLLRSAGSALIWCPTSNVFLFGRTHSRGLLRQLPMVALASDSPLTAQGDLLDEVHFAASAVEVSPSDLYSMVTTRAAQILRLKNGEGAVRIGAYADVVAIRDTGHSPADSLAAISYRDVDLVLIGGRVHLASPQVHGRLAPSLAAGLFPLEIEGQVRWIRAPLQRLFSETRPHLGDEIKLGGRAIRYGGAV